MTVVLVVMRAERINNTISFTRVSIHEILIMTGTSQKECSNLFSPQKCRLKVKPVCIMELMYPQIEEPTTKDKLAETCVQYRGKVNK